MEPKCCHPWWNHQLDWLQHHRTFEFMSPNASFHGHTSTLAERKSRKCRWIIYIFETPLLWFTFRFVFFHDYHREFDVVRVKLNAVDWCARIRTAKSNFLTHQIERQHFFSGRPANIAKLIKSDQYGRCRNDDERYASNCEERINLNNRKAKRTFAYRCCCKRQRCPSAVSSPLTIDFQEKRFILRNLTILLERMINFSVATLKSILIGITPIETI